ncbi:MAG: hypothetical protein DRP11_01065 [Candidatus Aenigmatarchaeota archaeon]|nr:MAG: hypothetical protein DRP11_01065 [Candidatus Aenigmarchaeota archaeon]
MPKLRVEDKCDITIHKRVKNVPNPQNIYHEIIDILINRCSIGKNDINEEFYEHEKTEDSEKVHIELTANKVLDKHSKLVIDIEINITMKPVNKKDIKFIGDVEIEVEGFVRTEYPQDTAIQKSLLWNTLRGFYEKTLYSDVREDMMKLCNKVMRKLKKNLDAYFNLLPKV